MLHVGDWSVRRQVPSANQWDRGIAVYVRLRQEMGREYGIHRCISRSERIFRLPRKRSQRYLSTPRSLHSRKLDLILLFRSIVPNFHIFFYTFSSTVFLRTDYEQVEEMGGNLVEIFGIEHEETQREEAAELLRNRGTIRRTLYICREKPTVAGLSEGERGHKLQEKGKLSETTPVSSSKHSKPKVYTELP